MTSTASPRITFNTTNYNTAPITARSLDSIVDRMEGVDYEIVCVDNFSDDGSYEVLAEYRDRGVPILLSRAKCGRGLGRQIALRQARGEVVVTFDLDTVYNEDWKRLFDWYLERRPPYVLIATYSGFYPKAALDAVGGWRDFQYWEDVDLWIRLATKGLWRTYPMKCGENYKRVPLGVRKKTRRMLARMRDTLAVAKWVPFWVYWKGYGKAFPLTRTPVRNLYYHGLLAVSYLPGRIRRYRMCRRDFRPESMVSPDVFVDCDLVPPDQLRPFITQYDTREGVVAAAKRGDYFLAGTYD